MLATYAMAYGATYAYRLHYIANLICAWLVAVHFSEHSLSISGLTHMLESPDEDDHRDLKKRP